MGSPTKVIGRRSLAVVIDWLIGFGIYVGLVVARGEEFEPATSGVRIETVNTTTVVQLGERAYRLTDSGFAFVALVATAWWILNLCVLTGLTGASVGKLVSGIRVVRADGAICGVGRAFVRWLVLIVDAFPYFVPLVGFVTALATDGNRRVGDVAAGTFVVRASAVGEPIAVGARPAPAYGYAPAATDAQWDPARGAWIRWDGTAWTRYDQSTATWRPL